MLTGEGSRTSLDCCGDYRAGGECLRGLRFLEMAYCCFAWGFRKLKKLKSIEGGYSALSDCNRDREGKGGISNLILKGFVYGIEFYTFTFSRQRLDC